MTHDPDSKPHNIAPLLIAVAQSWRRAIAQELAADGLSDAMALPLVHLNRDGDGIRQNDLAERVGVESTAMVRILDQLERGGQIRREPHPKDRRAKLVFLTEAGLELARHAEVVLGRLRLRLLEEVAPGDLEAAGRMLETVKSAFATREEERG